LHRHAIPTGRGCRAGIGLVPFRGMPGCWRKTGRHDLSLEPMSASPPSRNNDHADFSHSRVSDETLSRLYEFASPTRTSLYDRPWFLGLLVAIAIAVVVAGAFLVLQLLH